LWKKILDNITEAVKANTDEMLRNAEARKALGILEENPSNLNANVTVYDEAIRIATEDFARQGLEYNKILSDIEKYREILNNDPESIYAGGELTRLENEKAILDVNIEYINNLEKLKKPYEDILKRDEARTLELERQKKLISDMVQDYNRVAGLMNDRYSSTPQGRIEELKKEIAGYEQILKRGRPQESANTQEFGPGNRYE
jgi:DNA integrity scanning protein DisA with diadenylate cyclase activity